MTVAVDKAATDGVELRLRCALPYGTTVDYQCVLSFLVSQVLAVQGKLKDKLAPPLARRAQGVTSLPAATPPGRTQDNCVFLKVGWDAVIYPLELWSRWFFGNGLYSWDDTGRNAIGICI